MNYFTECTPPPRDFARKNIYIYICIGPSCPILFLVLNFRWNQCRDLYGATTMLKVHSLFVGIKGYHAS